MGKAVSEVSRDIRKEPPFSHPCTPRTPKSLVSYVFGFFNYPLGQMGVCEDVVLWEGTVEGGVGLLLGHGPDFCLSRREGPVPGGSAHAILDPT